MATFELTARHTMFIGSKVVEKGTLVTFSVHVPCITPSNLLTSSKCKEDVLRGFDKQGNIQIPPNSQYLSSAHWDIKIK